MEMGSNFWGFSISFSDARRLQGIEGGGEKEAYGAQPTPYKQANKHIHIATHVQMHSDAKSVTSPRAGVCVCVRIKGYINRCVSDSGCFPDIRIFASLPAQGWI